MAGLLTRRQDASGLPNNISDHQCLLHGKGDSQLRDSRGFSPGSHLCTFSRLSRAQSSLVSASGLRKRSHFNRSSNHNSGTKLRKNNETAKLLHIFVTCVGKYTVLEPVYWELLEPVEGQMDFTLIDRTIRLAHQQGQEIIFLSIRDSIVFFRSSVAMTLLSKKMFRHRSGKPLYMGQPWRSIFSIENFVDTEQDYLTCPSTCWMFCSRWQMCTSIPNFRYKCSAKC